MKRLLGVLGIAFLLSMLVGLPGVVRASPASIQDYSPETLEIGVLNRAMFQDDTVYKAFYSQYVMGTSPWNIVDKFGPDPLSYHNDYIRPSFNRTYQFFVDNYNLLKLQQKGDLQMMLRATVHNLMHYGPNHKKKEVLAWTYIRLIQGVNQNAVILADRGCFDKKTGAIALGDHIWLKPNPTEPGWGVTFKLEVRTASETHSGCNCGDARISNIALAVADAVPPKLTGAFFTANINGGDVRQSFGKDETFYIHLEFDENMRLSDHSCIHDDALLYLDVYDTGGQQVTGSNVAAKLCRVAGNKVTFCYTVGDTVAEGVPTNHYIGGISKNQPGLISGPKRFPLVLLDDQGFPVVLPTSLSGYSLLTETTSLLTDLAGNPVSSLALGLSQDRRCKLDSQNPYVEKVDASQDPAVPIFAGPDHHLIFTASFNETLKVSQEGLSKMRAYVNLVGRGDNTQVSVLAQSISEDCRTVTFEPLLLTKDMKPVPCEIGGKTVNYATIASISHEGGITDLCGNPYEGGDLGVASRNQYYVDTLAPYATTTQDLCNGQYSPDIDSSVSGFRFAFNLSDSVSDDPGGGKTYTSGLSQRGEGPAPVGEFSWKNREGGGGPYRFEWKVTSSPQAPTDGWLEGATEERYSIPQIEGDSPQYLHVRLLDDAVYNIFESSLVFYPKDFSGNQGETAFPIDYVADDVGPAYLLTGYSTSYDASSAKGLIKANLLLVDGTGTNPGSIRYMWVNRSEGTPGLDDSGWVSYTGTPQGPETALQIEINTGALDAGADHLLDLCLTAKDTKTPPNESLSEAFPLEIYLSHPAYGAEVADAVSVRPGLYLTPPSSHPTLGLPSTMVVLVRDPRGPKGNEYFMRTMNSLGWGKAEDIFGDLIWTTESWENNVYTNEYASKHGFLGPRVSLEEWKYVVLTENDDFTLWDGSIVENVQYGFADYWKGAGVGESVVDLYIWSISNYFSDQGERYQRVSAAQRLMAIAGGKYYGDVEIRVIVGYGTIGPDVWEVVPGHPKGGGVYDVNPLNQGIFVNEAAYYWEDSPDPNKRGYYYDYDCEPEHEVPLCWAVYPDDRPASGNYVSYIPKDALVKETRYVLKAASGKVVLVPRGGAYDYAPLGWYDGFGELGQRTYDLSAVYKATIEPVRKDLLAGVADWGGPADGPRYVSSIDGEEIRVTLENLIVPSWGISDVDFDSPDTCLLVYMVNSPESGAPLNTELCRVPLAPKADQRVTLPKVTVGTGQYGIRVSVKAKASGIVSSDNYYDVIYVDRTPIPEFGIAKTETTISGDLHTWTTEKWYGYDSSSSNVDYTYPDLLIGNAVGEHVSSIGHKIYFTAKTAGKEHYGGYYGELYMKAWNASGDLNQTQIDAGKGLAGWFPLGTQCSFGLGTVVVDEPGALLGGYKDDQGEPTLPLLSGRENIICYQVSSSYGTESATCTFFARVSDEVPELHVEVTPEDSDVVLPSALAQVTHLRSNILDGLSVYYLDKGSLVPVEDATLLYRSGDHVFMAVDGYGNCTFEILNVDFVDGEPPTVECVYNLLHGDHFEVKYAIRDTYMPGGRLPKGFFFYLRYDEAYNQLLGLEPDEFTRIELPDYTSEISSDRSYVIEEPSKIGIYEVLAVPRGDSGSEGVTVVLSGILKPDDSDDPLVSHLVEVYAQDLAGNCSSVQSVTVRMNNVVPAMERVELRDDYDWEPGIIYVDVVAVANQPIMMISPKSKTPDTFYSTEKHRLYVYADADGYEFEFTDVFGDYHSQNLDVTCISDLGLQVDYSTTEPTKGVVTVDIRPAVGSTVFSAWMGKTLVAYECSYFDYDFEENGTMRCLVHTNGGRFLYVDVPVTNIYKGKPEAEVTWYYKEFAQNQLPSGATQTTDEVMVYISTPPGGRPIHSAAGEVMSHTFSYGDEAGKEHTFRFVDAAGNEGDPLTVSLPLDIVLPELIPGDVTPPRYHLNIYRKRYDIHSLVGSWSNVVGWKGPFDSLPETLEDISWTSGYILDFDYIQDESPTRLLLLPDDAVLEGLDLDFDEPVSADIPNVTLSRKSVLISENASFYIVVLDQAGNWSALSVEAVWVDVEAPTITINKVKTDFYRARLYVGVKDEDGGSGDAFLVSPAGAPKLSDSAPEYGGWYYFDFEANGGIQVVAEDAAGNRASATGIVDDIDLSAPTSRVLWWSPSVGEDRRDPIDGPTNRDVSVGLSFDRMIVSLSVSAKDSAWNQIPEALVGDYVTAELLGDRATITFRDHVSRVLVEYTGQNGKVGQREFVYAYDYYFVIDKTPPNVTVEDYSSQDIPTNASVEVVFHAPSDEDIVAEDGKEYSSGETFKKEIASQGIFNYRFYDAAKNVTVITVEVKEIDTEPPVIMVMGEDDLPKQGQHTIYVTLSEAGTIEFEGETYQVSAPVDRDGDGKLSLNDFDLPPGSRECDWKELVVRRNGTYRIAAQDVAGWSSSTYVTVFCLDNDPPSLAFSPPTTLSVCQGTSLSDFQDLFLPGEEGMAGLVLSDNVTAREDIEVTVDLSGWTEARLSGTGIWPVVYRVKDGAGNTRDVNRNVRVYPLGEPVVSVNGQKTERDSTTVFSGVRTFTLDVGGLAGGEGEPYKVYMHPGRYTSGQMKSIGVQIGSTFNLDKGGFYTLMVVPQSRVTYITYLYVE